MANDNTTNKEYRCKGTVKKVSSNYSCNKLLATGDAKNGSIIIKCPRCNHFNEITENNNGNS